METLQPDIVVMDIRMRGMDGITAAREIGLSMPI
jgi:CheY-like chemotaxis protein